MTLGRLLIQSVTADPFPGEFLFAPAISPRKPVPLPMDCRPPQGPAESATPLSFAARARRAMTGFLPRLGRDQKDQDADQGGEEFLPVVDLASPPGGGSGDAATRVTAAQALPGFDEAKALIVDAIASRADRLTLETAAESTIWHDIDGVRLKRLGPDKGPGHDGQWKETTPLSRDAGMAIARVLRILTGLSETGTQQAGVFGFTVDRTPALGRMTAARSTTGERIVVQFVTKATVPPRLVDAGMPEPMVDQVAKIIDHDRGLLVLSSPPGHGLTTSLDLLVEASDRFLRDFVTIADRDRPGREIVNLGSMPYGHQGDPPPADLLKTAMNKNIGVIIAPDVRDKDFVADLVKVAATKAMVLMTIKAADAAEAVGKLLKCGVDPKVLGSAIRGSLSQRLVRRLCPRCRAQAESPASLRVGSQSVGTENVQVFTAAPHGCQLCRGRGYQGRIGLFELAAGDTCRRVAAVGGSVDQLRQAAVKDGMLSLRNAGRRLVSEGTTSREEIERVLAIASPATESGGSRK